MDDLTRTLYVVKGTNTLIMQIELLKPPTLVHRFKKEKEEKEKKSLHSFSIFLPIFFSFFSFPFVDISDNLCG